MPDLKVYPLMVLQEELDVARSRLSMAIDTVLDIEGATNDPAQYRRDVLARMASVGEALVDLFTPATLPETPDQEDRCPECAGCG